MPDYFTHPSSFVDQGAVIGRGTKIWHYCHIMPLAIIGEDCIIGQNCFIDNFAEIGNNVKIQNNVSIYTGVKIEEDVFIGPSVVFTNVINPRSFIVRKTEFKKTLVKKGASIGANATIICGIQIGSYALIGAGALVSKQVPAFALVMGNPAKQTGWVSEQGYALHFDEEGMAVCKDTGQRYFLKNSLVVKL